MLTLIPTPIGNIQDITYRAIKSLKESNLILCEDTRVTKQLINLLNSKLNAGIVIQDIISFHEHNGVERLKVISNRLESENVVYVSDAGMPSISDPGVLLVKYCQDNGIDYDVLPGSSVPPLIYAACGFDSGRFIFYGFLPHKGRERRSELNRVLSHEYDTILYESPHRLKKLIEEICAIDEDRELFVAKEISKKFQKFFRCKAKEFLDILNSISIKGEWALVIKGAKKSQSIDINTILDIDIPPKAKAKVLAKLTNTSTKEWYDKLQSGNLVK